MVEAKGSDFYPPSEKLSTCRYGRKASLESPIISSVRSSRRSATRWTNRIRAVLYDALNLDQARAHQLLAKFLHDLRPDHNSSAISDWRLLICKKFNLHD